MKRAVLRTVAAVGALGVGLAVAGCSGAAKSGPTEIVFWGWSPGYGDAAEAFNASQDEIVVTYEEIAPGSKGGYDKMLNASKAGSAPCLAQVGYETLTSFAAQGVLQDVSEFAKDSEDEFQPAPWSAVNIGDAVYGAPVDQGPMALYYNKGVFDSLGIDVPTTWAEYQAAGEQLKAAGKFLSAGYLNYDYAGFAWQAEAPWFSISDDTWNVSIDSSGNQDVAAYWQTLIDGGMISPAPMWDQSWYAGLGDGSIATHVGAVWLAGVFTDSVPDGAGQWAVAPMPQWEAGETKVGNVGGSATAVMKGCDDPEAAWSFAHFMSTDADTYTGLIEDAALYPAATELLGLPALSEPDEYFGDQVIFDVFAEASEDVATGWTWGPNTPETVGFLDDGLSKAWAGQGGTLVDAVETTQKKTFDALDAQGISVSE
ncbi:MULTISPECIES: ABC transporter substrate-binding protein [unclassified Microbacterium]|uniref:ABC transporter substrate-binding protein n=1 Tax=unclassified Microbacterium TaxID=2609290 RepID=UPI00197C17E2|nr:MULTISPECIES: extracellular solute-binding protein [unclassified Microbacterium]